MKQITNLLKPAWDFLRDDKGLPTVKVVISSLVLIVSVDAVSFFTTHEDSWNGQQKLVALGIIAGTRVFSVLITTLGQRVNNPNNNSGNG